MSTNKADTSTHWFHRNLLKFTALQEFNCENTCKGPLAQKTINDVKMARFDLLNCIYELHSNREEVMKKFETYISLLLGLCQTDGHFVDSKKDNEVEDQGTNQSENPDQTPQQAKSSGNAPKSNTKSFQIKVSPRYYWGLAKKVVGSKS